MSSIVLIETARLILRAVTMADIDGVASNWKLDEGPIPLPKADEFVRRVDWVLGIIAVITGIGFVFMRSWIFGLILLSSGGMIFGIAAGKIR